MDKLSPMMNHYQEVKKNYQDAIIMYRLGDFYEMFFDDAIEASKILELTLTGRSCGLAEKAPMCGVPYHAVDSYISKLIKAGKKVAICEQLTTPSDQKGMVERDVVRVVTAGTTIEDDILDSKTNNYLACVLVTNTSQDKNNDRLKDEVIISYADISTGEVLLQSCSKVGLEEFLLNLAPSEIIANSLGYDYCRQFKTIQSGKLPRVQSYYDYSFNKDNASKCILDFYNVYSLQSIGLDVYLRYVPCLGALIAYIQNTQKRGQNHFIAPKIISSDTFMFLDYNAMRNLEIIESLEVKGTKNTLLATLDDTQTPMGARMIKKWLSKPLMLTLEIEKRQDAVEELFKSPLILQELNVLLSNIKDMERVSGHISFDSVSPRECLIIANSLKQIPVIKKALKEAKCYYLKEIISQLNSLDALTAHIFSIINDENTPQSIKDGNVIRSGFNKDLDELRCIRSNGGNWMKNYEAKERELTGIKGLKVGYNRIFGYYIEITKSNFGVEVPFNYTRKQTLANCERYTTEELKQMEERILSADEKTLKLEEAIYIMLKKEMRDNVSKILDNASNIAQLDVLSSFAKKAIINNYVRPEIGGNDIIIKGGRHPVVECLKKSNEYVSNDTILNLECSTMIVTGPNMAGKSTYMRQIALIVIMAHIGSFVPASQAKISIVDRVFTRIGASDNLSLGQSTFMVEMIEVANIVNNATQKSLLILDEIGRGTSTLDGLGIAWAVIEDISVRIKPKTLFATHFHELISLEKTLPSVKNYHMLIKEDQNQISFLYKLSRGGASKSFGAEVAALAGVKKQIIARAKDIMAQLEEIQISDKNISKILNVAPSPEAIPAKQMTLFEQADRYQEIADIIVDVDIDNCTPIQAFTILSNLKKQVKILNKKGK